MTAINLRVRTVDEAAEYMNSRGYHPQEKADFFYLKAKGLEARVKNLERGQSNLVRIYPDDHADPDRELHHVQISFSTVEMKFVKFTESLCMALAKELTAYIYRELMAYVKSYKSRPRVVAPDAKAYLYPKKKGRGPDAKEK